MRPPPYADCVHPGSAAVAGCEHRAGGGVAGHARAQVRAQSCVCVPACVHACLQVRFGGKPRSPPTCRGLCCACMLQPPHVVRCACCYSHTLCVGGCLSIERCACCYRLTLRVVCVSAASRCALCMLLPPHIVHCACCYRLTFCVVHVATAARCALVIVCQSSDVHVATASHCALCMLLSPHAVHAHEGQQPAPPVPIPQLSLVVESWDSPPLDPVAQAFAFHQTSPPSPPWVDRGAASPAPWRNALTPLCARCSVEAAAVLAESAAGVASIPGR